MDERAATARAIALSLLVHVAIVGSLWLATLNCRNWENFFHGIGVPEGWSPVKCRVPLSVAGEPIEAVLITNPEAFNIRPVQPVERPQPPTPTPPPPAQPQPEPPAAPRPQPQPEPRPQQAETPPQPEPQQPVPRPDTVEQERAARLAIEQRERAQREQEERRRQEQIDLTERQRQQEEAERRERMARQQREREEQLAEIRRQREAAERASRMEQQRMEQLADRQPAQPSPRPSQPSQPAQAAPGTGGTDESLAARYALALQQAIERNWIRPETVRSGVTCRIRITQIPGGEVISAAVDASCPYDDLGKRSVEAAVLRAQPLPYAGFESVFQRQLTLNFRAP